MLLFRIIVSTLWMIVLANRSLKVDWKFLTYNNSLSLDNQTENDTTLIDLTPLEYDNYTENFRDMNETTDELEPLVYDVIDNAIEYDNASMIQNDTIIFVFGSQTFYNNRPLSSALLLSSLVKPSDINIHDAVEQFVTQRSGTFDLVPPFMVLKSFCPVNIGCNNKYVDLHFNENRCCIRCSCSKQCKNPHRCCQHIFLRPINQPRNRCTQTSIGDTSMIAGSLGAMTYDLCEDDSNEALVQKCYGVGLNDYDLWELIPAYGTIRNRTYTNIYCAQCNNEIFQAAFAWQTQSIIPWKTNLICKDTRILIKHLNRILVDPTFIFGVSYLKSHGCYIQWSPKETHSQCALSQNWIDKCRNESFTDANVKLLCGIIEAPVRGRLGMYLNLYCLICNEGYSSYEEKCSSDFDDIHESLYDIRTRTHRTMLRLPDIVVSLIAESVQTNGIKQKEPNMNLGMVKVCPITSLIVEGRCINVIKELRGISLDFIFKGIFPAVNKSQLSDLEILSEVRSIVNIGSDGSHICAEHILAMHQEDNDIIVVVQLTSIATNLLDVKNEYDRVNERLARLKSSFLRSVEFYPSPLEFIKDGPVTLAGFTNAVKSPDCGRSIAMTNLQFCNICQFNNYVNLDNAMIEINQVRFTAGEYLIKSGTNQSVLLCCELYHTRFNESLDESYGSLVGSGNTLVSFQLSIVVMMLSLFQTVRLFMI